MFQSRKNVCLYPVGSLDYSRNESVSCGRREMRSRLKSEAVEATKLGKSSSCSCVCVIIVTQFPQFPPIIFAESRSG